MFRFEISDRPLEPAALEARLHRPDVGGIVSFVGRVRNHHQGRAVRELTYECHRVLAQVEAQRILFDAAGRFPVLAAGCVHRIGTLPVGEAAIWVGAAAAHRAEAFQACSFLIEELKAWLPVWKKETYVDGTSAWINCAACAPVGTG